MDIEAPLIQAVVEGDGAAEDTFARRCRPFVLAVARGRFALSQDAAEEVCQQVMVNLFEHDRRALRAWRGEGKFTTYLTVIAARACLRLRGSGTTEPIDGGREPSAGEAGPVRRLEAEEKLRALERGIKGLRPRDRLLLRLRFGDGKEPAEIATLLSLKPATARKAIHDALKRLRSALRVSDAELFPRSGGNAREEPASHSPRRHE